MGRSLLRDRESGLGECCCEPGRAIRGLEGIGCYKWEHVVLSYLHDATRLDGGGGVFGFTIPQD